ncbi:hypothetical protein DPMN_104271 [Dreissena polymorpha]|uniref:Mitochondria-eating protein C-terminal domain-containing protein n=1 Tax=Dreissena polymorpha TaxID=45954 RepID=A0A9D4HA31_DREPO|nr:hypothetical protein DPMN_104271 [Dreissena polymorpha]
MCCDECKDVASSQRLHILGYLKLLPNATSKDMEIDVYIRAISGPYTASGTELDYVVWPAMLLHEGGPILFKGIAQFKEKLEESQQETDQVTKVTDQILEKESNMNSQERNANSSEWD